MCRGTRDTLRLGGREVVFEYFMIELLALLAGREENLRNEMVGLVVLLKVDIASALASLKLKTIPNQLELAAHLAPGKCMHNH
jgi:hypothetical protein